MVGEASCTSIPHKHPAQASCTLTKLAGTTMLKGDSVSRFMVHFVSMARRLGQPSCFNTYNTLQYAATDTGSDERST